MERCLRLKRTQRRLSFFLRRCLHSKIKIRSALLVLSHALTQNWMLRFFKLPLDLLSGIRERQASKRHVGELAKRCSLWLYSAQLAWFPVPTKYSGFYDRQLRNKSAYLLQLTT